MLRKKIAGLLAALAVLAGVAFATAPTASATTALGSWWTNYSYCTDSNGNQVRSQGRYTNTSGPNIKTDGYGALISGPNYQYIKKYTVTEYTDSSKAEQIGYYASPTGNYGKSLSTTFSSIPTVHNYGNTIAVYQVWIYTGAADGFCQGQWNVGQ